jgi:hypothetical protein
VTALLLCALTLFVVQMLVYRLMLVTAAAVA